MFGRIRSEFQCLEGKGQNSSVWKDKVRISMSGQIRTEVQCLVRSNKNSNVLTDKIRIQCLER